MENLKRTCELSFTKSNSYSKWISWIWTYNINSIYIIHLIVQIEYKKKYINKNLKRATKMGLKVGLLPGLLD